MANKENEISCSGLMSFSKLGKTISRIHRFKDSKIQLSNSVNIPDIDRWMNMTREIYFSYLETNLKKGARYQINEGDEYIGKAIRTDLIHVDFCDGGTVSLYDVPLCKNYYRLCSGGVVQSAEKCMVKDGDDVQFLVVPYVSSFSDNEFLTSVYKVIHKYQDLPDFQAIVSIHEVWMKDDKVYAGIGFFHN